MTSLLGTVLISLSVLGFGYSYITQLRTEAECLKGLLRLIQRIRTRIECFRSPLHEIYRDFSDPYLDRIGFTEELNKNGFSFALIKSSKRLCISDGIINELNEFGEGLGKSYYDEQLRICNECIARLENALKEHETALPQKSRLCLSVTVAGALMSAILFI